VSAELYGRLAIVTGAGRGLGRAFSLELAARGADVAIVDLDEAIAESVAQEIGTERARAFVADISDEEAVTSMLLGVQSWRGDAAVLINSAAMFATLAPTPLTEIPVTQWDAVLGVNLRGTFLCCRAVVPGMSRAGYGKIVNLSSSAFWLGRPGYPHYVSSKGGGCGAHPCARQRARPRWYPRQCHGTWRNRD